MRVHHLAFRTDDVPRLFTFYAELLGLPIVREALPRSIWLGLEGGAVLMIERREAGEPPVPEGTLELVAFGTDALTADALRSRIAERGLLEAETTHTVYFRDPDGRRVGVSTYPLPSLDAGRR